MDSLKNKRNPINHLEYENGQKTAILHSVIIQLDIGKNNTQIQQFIKEKQFMKPNDSKHFIEGYDSFLNDQPN